MDRRIRPIATGASSTTARWVQRDASGEGTRTFHPRDGPSRGASDSVGYGAASVNVGVAQAGSGRWTLRAVSSSRWRTARGRLPR